MKRVDQFYFMTNLTKKISLLVVEKRFEISTYFVDYLFDLFKDVNFYNEEKEILNFNKIRIPDIAFIDLQTEGINIFQLIKDLKRANPSINIVLFSDVLDEKTHLACEDSQVEYLISTKSSIFQLKEIIIKCIKSIILKNRNKLLLNDKDNINEKIDSIDCMNYLLKTKQNSIDLIAHYKGVSFIKKAHVLKVDGSFIHIKIDKTHKFVFKHLSHAVVSSVHLSSDIFLNLVDIDFKNDVAIFNKSTYINSYVHNRKSPRVEPSNKLRLLCEFNKRYQNVEILNISMNYILISLPEVPNNLCIDSQINIHLSYHDKNILNNNFHFTKYAKVKGVFDCKDGNKILLHFPLLEEEEEQIAFYIKNRIKELITDLNKYA